MTQELPAAPWAVTELIFPWLCERKAEVRAVSDAPASRQATCGHRAHGPKEGVSENGTGR